MQPQDYANVETNLFPKIRERFVKDGSLSPIDLLAILVWKANRASGMHIERFGGPENFVALAPELGRKLFKGKDAETRLKVAMTDQWKFRLPTATALLTVLFPLEFTVYDRRVCDRLGAFHELAGRRFTNRLYPAYDAYKAAVVAAVPSGLSLREADHYLWGQSWLQDARKTLGM